MKNINITLVLLFTILYSSTAQDLQVARYATQRVQQQLFDQYPQYLDSVDAINQFALSYKPSPKDQVKKEAIPIVFHILYHPDQSFPDQAAIELQLAALNGAFNSDKAKREYKHKADTLEGFSKRVAKMELSFCAPKAGPDGDKKQSYINYVEVDSLDWSLGENMKSETTGGANPWDPAHYLNVWVVHLKPGLRGFAQMPGAGPVATDGIVIDRQYFGVDNDNPMSFNQGKTLVHLVGSYLGLYELWNEYERCKDDYVFDTPIHNDPNLFCPEYQHVTTCDGNEVEMTMNFMDSTPDTCLRMFTNGQKYRLYAMLSEKGPRAGLLQTDTKCNNTKLLSAAPPTFLLDEVEPKDIDGDLVRIFPNPAKSAFMVDWKLTSPGAVSIMVSNIHNQRVELKRQLDPLSGQLEIQSSAWPAGVYIVTVLQDQRIVSTQRIIINH